MQTENGQLSAALGAKHGYGLFFVDMGGLGERRAFIYFPRALCGQSALLADSDCLPVGDGGTMFVLWKETRRKLSRQLNELRTKWMAAGFRVFLEGQGTTCMATTGSSVLTILPSETRVNHGTILAALRTCFESGDVQVESRSAQSCLRVYHAPSDTVFSIDIKRRSASYEVEFAVAAE